MQATIQNLKVKFNNNSSLKSRACSPLQELCTEAQYHQVSALISEMNSQFYHEIKAVKTKNVLLYLNHLPPIAPLIKHV